MAILNVLSYYKELFENLNEIAYKNFEHYCSNPTNEIKNDLKAFSLLIMVRENNTDGFSWFLTDKQRERVLVKLKKNKKINKLVDNKIYNNIEEFYDTWIKFKFKETGLINYFINTDKNIEVLEEVGDEDYLIGKGYENDYKSNPNLINARNRDRVVINDGTDFDPFLEVEKTWAFENLKNLNFYYFKIPTDDKTNLEFVGLLVFCNNKPEIVLTLINDIQSATYGASLMSITMQDNIKSLRLSNIKSAIAAIMSRNGSHNIGSHVMTAVTYNIVDPPDMQVFTRYVQERMDFTAQITTEMPTWTASMRFINQIMRNFYMQRVLLNYIVEAEGLKAKEFTGVDDKENNKNKLQIVVLDKDGKEVIPNGDELDANDPLVAIPGGVTGMHAFYVILENIIRNAAKHSYKKDNDTGEGLQIKIQYDATDDENVIIKIYDNVSEVNTNNLKSNLEVKLYSSFIEDDGQLKYKSWGLAEMKIGSGYLNKKSYEVIGSDDEKKIKDFIKVVEVKDNESSRIGYQIKIPKPKHVLIVDKEDMNISSDKPLRKAEGIYKIREITDNTNLDYEFIVLKNVETIGDDTISKLPARVFYCDENLFKNGLKDKYVHINDNYLNELCNNNNYKDYSNLRVNLYKFWVEQLMDKKSHEKLNININIFANSSGGASINNSELWKFILRKELDREEQLSDDEKNKIKELLQKKDISTLKIRAKINNNNELKEKITNIYKSFKYLYKKYEEDIETLPLNLRYVNKSNNENDKHIYKTENWTNKIEINNNKSKCKSISYKRHAVTDLNNYSEALSGSQSYFYELTSLFQNDNKKANDILIYGLVENALFNITIIDERVYKYIMDSNDEIKKRFQSIGLTIGNLIEARNTDNITESRNNFIEIYNVESLKKIKNDILIIHQGILDKLKIDKDTKIFWDEIRKNFKYVFVTSGRGKPESYKFPDWVKFIAFSNIRATLLKQYPEKYLLTQNLLKI